MEDDLVVIPDTQSKDKVKNPLIAVAFYIVLHRPRMVIHLGDHWDFPSLSDYDKGKKSHRARTYIKDVRAGNQSMKEFWEIIEAGWPEHEEECQFIILEGNHEKRRHRAREYGPDNLVDLLDLFPPDYSKWDKMVPFLKVFKHKGINFCHFIQQDKSDRPIGTARQLLSKRHRSCIVGHSQGFDYAESLDMDGNPIQAIVAGSCYYHDEEYKGHTNRHWRGIIHLRNIKKGSFDFSRHSLTSLEKEYCS